MYIIISVRIFLISVLYNLRIAISFAISSYLFCADNSAIMTFFTFFSSYTFCWTAFYREVRQFYSKKQISFLL